MSRGRLRRLPGASTGRAGESTLASAWQRIKVRWWLPRRSASSWARSSGSLLALSGGSVWRAQTIVYLGQPFAPLGGGQIQSLATNPRTVGEIIRSQATLEAASKASGIPVSRLRSSISTKELVAVGQASRHQPAHGDRGEGLRARKVRACSGRARQARDRQRVAVRDSRRSTLLEQQVATSEAQLAAVTARIQAAQEQQDALINDRSIPLDQRLLLSREPELRDHDRRRPAHVPPGRPLRGAPAPEPRRERRVEPRRRAGGCERRRPRARAGRRSSSARFIGLLVGLIAAIAAEPIARAPARYGAQLGLMFDGKRVAVVVPAYDEEALVGETLRGIPELVDRIYVVDDASSDATGDRARELGDPRVRGDPPRAQPGRRRRDRDRATSGRSRTASTSPASWRPTTRWIPQELQGLVEPVARGEVEYAKANRLVSGEAWKVIPRTRYLGNAVLSLLTKIASGYWHVADSQAGYTAISRGALERLDLDRLYPRYGFPNDLLVHLNVENARVRDVPSRPIYDVGEQSGIRLRSVVPRISWLLFKAFWWRMGQKYVIRDFHPLVFFYVFGVLMSVAGPRRSGCRGRAAHRSGTRSRPPTIVLVAVLLIAGLQMTLFAMWFDMEANKELR